MPLARHTVQVQDHRGNIVTGCQVEVLKETAGNPPAILYSDREGNDQIGNPIAVDINGRAAFHVAGGAYRIRAFKTGFEVIWRYVGIGRASESDIQALKPEGAWDVGATYAIGALVFHGDLLFASRLDDNVGSEPDAGSPPGDTANWMFVGSAGIGPEGPQGPQGDPGDQGDPGEDGADGVDPGYLFDFETATSSPPGAGAIRANNPSLAAATILYVRKTTRGGSDVAARLLELAIGSKTEPSIVILTDPATEAQASFAVGAVTDQTDYVEIAVSGNAGETSFSAGPISLQREISGPDGGGITESDAVGIAIAMAIVF